MECREPLTRRPHRETTAVRDAASCQIS
jgi:hypothetical protein